jgi:diketogulonate reductase-like aldo/keto reductase
MACVTLLCIAASAGAFSTTIPTHPLAGGGEMPMLAMGGNDFEGWFKVAGKGAMIQTFHGYGNGAHLAPQIQAAGRGNVFVSTGIPCGCCGSDAPKVTPMNKSLAMGYIMDELAQLNTTYVDLLLFHHRCKTPEETAAVWTAFEECKKTGQAKHIGVSNFNTHDLSTLMKTVTEPIEVLEAHFGVGMMDFAVIDFANKNNVRELSKQTCISCSN